MSITLILQHRCNLNIILTVLTKSNNGSFACNRITPINGKDYITHFSAVSYTRCLNKMVDGSIIIVDLYPVTGRQHQLWKHITWWGVFTPVSFHQLCHWDGVSYACLVDRGWLSSQLEGICNGRKHVCNSFSFDLTAQSIVTCPDPSSKSCENDVLLLD